MNEIGSWMTGVNRNVEGKQKPRIMRYSGGHPAYREHCDAVAAAVIARLRLHRCAVLAVENTQLIATVPRIAAQQYTRGTRVTILPSPFKFEPIRILMSWHRSTDAEPSLRWFRNQVGDIARQLA